MKLEERRNLIGFACGMKGSGKSTVLAELFTATAPRVISLDVTGETQQRNPGAVPVYSLAELWDFFAVAAGGDELGAPYESWHVAAMLPDAELPTLFHALAPPPTRDGPAGLSRLFGGIAVECGECDAIAPNGRTRPEVKEAFKRGRHHGLSLFMGTQRPSETDRLVSSQADWLCILAQSEPLDIEWIRRAVGHVAADIAAELPLGDVILWQRGAPTFAVTTGMGAARRVRAVVDRRTGAGAPAPAPAAAPLEAPALPSPGA